MSVTVLRERKECPKWLRDSISVVGGLNPYGEPKYDVVWSETATQLLADGEELQYKGDPPCWLLRKWYPPENYRTDDRILEAYAHRGRYEIIQPFVLHSVVDGRLHKESYPLCPSLLEEMVGIVHRAESISEEQMRREIKADQDKKERTQIEQIADSLQSASPRFIGPTSFPGGHIKTVVQQKMDQLQRNEQESSRIQKELGKGFGTKKLD